MQDIESMYKNQLYFSTFYQKDKFFKFAFKIAPKTIKWLGINTTKEVKDLYTANYKTLMKALRKTKINGKI